MKKKILLFLPTAFLCLVSTYTLLAAAHSDVSNQKNFFIAFLIVIFLHLFYYIWLIQTKRIGTKVTIFYIPIAFVLFVVSIFSIIYPPWFKRVGFDMGPDPFTGSTTITSFRIFAIWDKEFWSKRAREEYRLNRLKQMQTARQGSLIGNLGTDLQGWTAEKVKSAFGEPSKIIQVNENLEKWIYHPWTNHLDWEMPVYIQNRVLLKIGD